MVDEARQVPALTATGWRFDLSAYRGPSIVVLRQNESDAVSFLTIHLVSLGFALDGEDARSMLAEVHVEHVGVVW